MSVLSIRKPACMELDELNIFEHSVARFLDTHATPTETASWRTAGAVPAQLWRQAGDAGLLGTSGPTEYGGAGVDFRYDVIVLEQLGFKHALNFAIPQIGRAHVWTPVTNAHLGCRLLLAKQ